MRIGYDLRPAVKPNSARRGVGRYALEVFKAIRRENPHPQIIPYLIKGRPELNEFRSDGRLLSYLPRPSRMNWMVDWLQLPVQFRRDQLDLFHATDLIVLPVSVKTRIWMTVHDLIPYVFWKETVRRIPRDYVLFLRQAWKQIKRADRIITSSEFSRRDICRRAGIDPRRVSVAYLGCNEELKHVPGPEARSRLESAYGISGPFLFYVGGTDYRKNLPFLLRAFAMIRARGYEGRLVLGGDTFQQEIPEVLKLEELARKLGIEDRILKPGFIPDPDLAAFYSACDFFVFPSKYEGFGLPVLEAMKCGAAVLTSGATSIPEVAGDCAGYFDPDRPEEMAERFWELVEDPDTVEARREAGRKRAARFTWRETARRILELYEQNTEYRIQNTEYRSLKSEV